MYVQIIQYDFTGDVKLFKSGAEALAPSIAQLDGFVAKLWLDGQGTQFGGVYLWRDEAAAESYRFGDLFTTALVESPDVSNLTVSGYDLWSDPTRETSGGLRIAV